ncbi:MAG: leucine-rich repeat domain-containing protein [Bacteroidia bacterium]
MRKFYFLFCLLLLAFSVRAQQPIQLAQLVPAGSFTYTDIKSAVKESSQCYWLNLSGPVEANAKVLAKLPSLSNLMILQLSANSYSQILPGFCTYSSLIYFSAEKNPIEFFPDSFAMLGQLKYLDLYQTSLDSFSNGMVWLPRLQSLRIVANTDTFCISKNITALERTLERLVLDSTHLDSLPASIGTLKKLKHLSLVHTGIDTLPAAIKKLTALETLLLDGNQLTELPNEIKYLKNLKVLSLRNNKIQHINSRICFLENLSVLDLRGNAISEYEVACLKVLLPGCQILI